MKIKVFFLFVLISFSIFYPWLSGRSLTGFALERQFMPPSMNYPAGTDIKGVDLLLKTAYAMRLSLSIAVISALISFFVGLFYGLISGYSGGKTDLAMMRIVDILYGLPFTLLVIVLTTIFGRNIFILFIALGLVQWLTLSRITRGETLSIRSEAYCDYARISGAGGFFIIRKHILPNVMPIALSYATLLVPAVILEESFISYLGLGVKPPAISMGSLISEGFRTINPVGFHWWLFLIPVIFLVITVFLFFSIGNTLKQKHERH